MENTLAAIEKKPEVQGLSKNATSALKWAENLEITTEKQKESATAAAIKIGNEEKNGDKMRKFFTDPLNEQVKKINALFMPNIKMLGQAGDIIRRKLGDYHAKQEAIAEKARQKVEADLEAGKIKNVETAVKKLDKIVEPEKTQRTEAATTTYIDKPEVIIVDENLIPRDFLTPDLDKIKLVAVANHKAGLAQIPGVKVEIRKVPSFRRN